MSYQDHVTIGLLYDTLQLFEEHGITRADNQRWRIAQALLALCQMADAIAGPCREES